MTAPARRRNNAPVRPRRRATTVPDVLFAIGMAALTMAVVFFLASFFDDSLSTGDVGTTLARAFAASLGLTAVFVFLLALLLLRDDRSNLDHYKTPLLLGVLIGLLESWLFLDAQPLVVLCLPLVLLIFALRPVRRALSALFRPSRPGRR
ncbi:MAG TPA: hypothetical protein PKI89_12555 [Tepidiformaceae bacterium]|nr:hypothetical protein [Tepidiformaceae bacterium]HNO66306.1 hypothetical protein [Tepidiformaceae bacterium]